MPRVDLVVSSNVKMSTKAKQLASMFELDPENTSESWSFDLELPEEWQIGLILGPSGSGKSTVGRHLFDDHFAREDGWPEDRTIVDGFGKRTSVKAVASSLSSVGFSSPPAWLRPFHALSNGQQFRANVARALADGGDLIVFDEFTSVVDRTVAQVGSAAVAKAVRRSPTRRLVAITCHYDVLDWLQPDWVLEMPGGTLTRREVQPRPEIRLQVERVDRSAWNLFRRHHYLNHSISNASKCFLAHLDGRPVAFASAIHFPHPTGGMWREHRTVCLPDFQGVGIGNRLSELVGSAFRGAGHKYLSSTSHPAMIRYRARSKSWDMFRKPSRVPRVGKGSTIGAGIVQSANRITASFRFRGKPNPEAARAFGLL